MHTSGTSGGAGRAGGPGAPRPTPLLSVPEAAALAGLSKAAAYRLAAAGELPGLVQFPGCQLMVRRRVLEAWLEGTELPAAPPPQRAPAAGRRAVKR
jgi:predicted DNA-binding transcriptional regulator AlpA